MGGATEDPLLSRASMASGLIGGLVHAGLTVVLWTYFGFDSLWEMLSVKPLDAVYLLLGAFLLGFVPVAFYAEQRVVSPAVIVGAGLVLSAVGSWFAGPPRAPSGAPTPFALYVLLWVALLALAVLSGGIEYRRTGGTTE